MKDIKVIFRGTKAPSGKTTDTEYMIGEARLELLKKSDMFDMEIIKSESTKPKKKAKKETKKENE